MASLRVPEDLWQRFGELAAAAGTDRSALLREFIAWYVREAGAPLPRRPGRRR
jgi:predicted DNA-binding protein